MRRRFLGLSKKKKVKISVVVSGVDGEVVSDQMTDTNSEGVGRMRARGAGRGGGVGDGGGGGGYTECGPGSCMYRGEPWPPALHVRGSD